MKVVIEPHNPQWEVEFLQIRDSLREILTGIPIVGIQHVGSTSIPGLVAKPLLDIDIIIKPIDLDATRAAIIAGGYLDLGELGVPGRFAFRQPGYGLLDQAGSHTADETGEKKEMRRNTYVCIEGCLSLRNHLDLKRVLLEDDELRNEYGKVKERLVAMENIDVDTYCRGKNEVMFKILKKAGWREEELEEVRKANE